MADDRNLYGWYGKGEKVAKIHIKMETIEGDASGKQFPALKAFDGTGKLLGWAFVSPGKNMATPEGGFKVLAKIQNKRSSYGDSSHGVFIPARMPFSMMIDHNGNYIHEGPVEPGQFLSKGCVRLPQGFAEKLFNATSVGTPITIDLK